MTQSSLGQGYALGVVILGAGRSSRMGRPKLLLPWGETSVLGHLVKQWHDLGARQVAVVCAVDDQAICSELERLGIDEAGRIRNPEPQRGMFSSIQCAARWRGWAPELSHWGIVLGDQPHLRLETLRELVTFSALHRDQVTQPAFAGRARHPVLMPHAVFTELSSSPASTLREFLNSHQRELCALADPGLDLDIDRPEDYAKAIQMAQTSQER